MVFALRKVIVVRDSDIVELALPIVAILVNEVCLLAAVETERSAMANVPTPVYAVPSMGTAELAKTIAEVH